MSTEIDERIEKLIKDLEKDSGKTQDEIRYALHQMKTSVESKPNVNRLMALLIKDKFTDRFNSKLRVKNKSN
jgi:uncharacterized protein YqgV (UPF0045/DUF77 family)